MKRHLTKFLLCSFLVCPVMLQAQHSVMIKTPDGRQFSISGDSTKYSFKATIARYEERYADAGRLKVQAIKAGEFKDPAGAYYDAACYMSLAETYDEAFEYLSASLKGGFDDVSHVMYDSDLDNLKADKRWKKVVGPYQKKYFKVNNEELASLYQADQQVRLAGVKDWDQVNREDSVRRLKVLKALDRGKVKSAHDYYKAAMIMHHGLDVEDNEKAHELALKALEFEDPHRMAPWLAAASKDRALIRAGKPQWFGTQGLEYLKVTRKMGINPELIDTTAVSSEQRAAWNAPTIETIRTYINNFKAEKKADSTTGTKN